MNQASMKILITCLSTSIFLVGTIISVFGQKTGDSKELDAKVEKFLNETRGSWYDSNVPEDGKVYVT
jgi:hypothetical protein